MRVPSATVALLFLLTGCHWGRTPSGAESRVTTAMPEGRTPTERMAKLLKIQFDEENPQTNFAANKKRVKFFEQKLAAADIGRADSLNFRIALAHEKLYAGDAEGSIEMFRKLLSDVKEEDEKLIDSPYFPWENTPVRLQLWYSLAVAFFRHGEIQNCIGHHNQRSCVFPIKGHGIHRHRAGSTSAVKIIIKLLEYKPDHQRLRWMLNLGYMTLGEYPAKVPAEYLIPPKAFASERDFPPFEDIAAKVGLDILRGAGSAVMDDFRNSGQLDVILSSPRLDAQIRVFKNNGKKGKAFAYEEITSASGLTGITDGKNLQQGDFDNDGCLDLLVVRGAYKQEDGLNPNSLLRGHCDGTFEDVTEPSGILRFEPTFTAAVWDYDNDGWLDLIIPNETAPPNDAYGRSEAVKDRGVELWHNNKNGTFTEVAKEAGLDINGNFKGVAWADYDNDGLGDLFLGETTGESRLYRNEGRGSDGRWRFKDVTKSAGFPARLKGRTLMFFDYDNDGFTDLFVGYGQAKDPIRFEDVVDSYLGRKVPRHPRMFRNNGNGTFSDVSEAIGLARAMPVMGANFGDVDYDGFPDLYLGTGSTPLDQLMPNRMFWNDRGKKFLDVTTASETGHLQKGHGVSFGDVDGNGTLDIVAQIGGGYEGDEYWSALFKNPGFGNNWLQIKAKGTISNRAGIGARIKLFITENGAKRVIHRTVDSGGSRGSNPLVQHIGVGRAPIIDRIEVHWPTSKKTTVLEKVKVNQWLTVEEK